MHRPLLLIALAALAGVAGFTLVPAASTATAPANIAYTDSSGSLFLATAAGTGAKTLFTGDDTTTVQALASSPDGKSILVATSDTELALVPEAGGKPVTINGTSDASSGDFSPDGKTVVFSTSDGIYTVPTAGGTAKKLLATPDGSADSLPVYSPSGKQIAFVRDTFDDNDDETLTVELVTIGSTALKDLAPGALPTLSSGGRLAFSPNGKTLAFAGSFDNPGIYTVPVAGGNANQLTSDNDFWPAYSADGSKILFSRDSFSDGADDQATSPVSSSDDDVYELWSMTAGGDNAAVIRQGDYETLVVVRPKSSTTTSTSKTTTSTTTTSTTPAVPGTLSVKLAISGKHYKVTWAGTATSWKVTLKVGKKTSTATVKGTVHSHTFTVTAKGAVSVTVAAGV